MPPKRSKRGRLSAKKDDNNAADDDAPVVSRRRRTSRTSQDKEEEKEAKEMQQEEEEQEDLDDHDVGGPSNDFCFSQQAPEASQGIIPERANERRNLESMDHAAREKALASLSRMILFKALEREPIDRAEVAKEAGLSTERITTAAIQEASNRLRNVFGFELNSIPKFMENIKGLPQKYKKRYYVLNGIMDSDDGSHSKAIHSVHVGSAVEKGLLLLTLALIFCKGESRSDGSRWLLGRDLYRLLHDVDDAIPEEPPAQGTQRAKNSAQKVNSRFQGNSTTPNVDYMLEQFVHWDYLIKEKATDENFTSQTLEEGDMIYAMGPRSAMEVGRRQIIYFCSEILDEEPDPTMLKEVEEEIEEEDEVFMEEAASQ